MRRVIVSEFLTLDGVMEDPGGAEKSRYGGWAFKTTPSEDQLKFKFDELFASGCLLLGRATYQGFAAAWPSVKEPSGFADRMNGIPKFVVSKTLQKLEWNNSKLLSGDVRSDVSELKEQPGEDILVLGSGGLVQTLMGHDLVDEYRLLVFPAVLGGGRRLFKEGGQAKLKLVETRPFVSGVVLLRYNPIRD